MRIGGGKVRLDGTMTRTTTPTTMTTSADASGTQKMQPFLEIQIFGQELLKKKKKKTSRGPWVEKNISSEQTQLGMNFSQISGTFDLRQEL